DSGGGTCERESSADTKPQSNDALCATNNAPCRNPAISAAIACIGGALYTMALVMPVSRVISDGIYCCGLTRDSKESTISPLRIFNMQISVMRLPAGDMPVVSTSQTTKSASLISMLIVRHAPTTSRREESI